MRTGIVHALLAALLFGTRTPFAELLVGHMPPVLLAGVLFAGSSVGLDVWLVVPALSKRSNNDSASLSAADLPWLADTVLSGGILGPVLLMTGLSLTAALTASLLPNL